MGRKPKADNNKEHQHMQENYPEIESLKLAIEAKTGGRLATPADFSRLTALIERETGCHVGLTTVKRLWGYVDSSSRLRDGTLSIFARFVGYRDWADFCAAVRDNAGTESSFLDGRQVSSTDLAAGDLLEIGWPPNRYCMIRHLGGGRFTVEKAVNGKLRAGDEFCASLFCLGEPLYITGLARQGGRPTSYVAGIKHGLTLIRIKNNLQGER